MIPHIPETIELLDDPVRRQREKANDALRSHEALWNGMTFLCVITAVPAMYASMWSPATASARPILMAIAILFGLAFYGCLRRLNRLGKQREENDEWLKKYEEKVIRPILNQAADRAQSTSLPVVSYQEEAGEISIVYYNGTERKVDSFPASEVEKRFGPYRALIFRESCYLSSQPTKATHHYKPDRGIILFSPEFTPGHPVFSDEILQQLQELEAGQPVKPQPMPLQIVLERLQRHPLDTLSDWEVREALTALRAETLSAEQRVVAQPIAEMLEDLLRLRLEAQQREQDTQVTTALLSVKERVAQQLSIIRAHHELDATLGHNSPTDV